MARSRWKRVVLWSVTGVVVVLVAVGGGSYLWFQKQVGAANARVDPDIIAALEEKPSTTTAPAATTTLPAPITTAASTTSTSTLTTTTAGRPAGSTTTLHSTTTSTAFESPTGMNMVLVGYDERPEGSSEVTEGRSDVIILVHVDPEKGFLSILSVPRDLRTEVEGYGHRKINAAYAFGGGALLIRTIQDRLGVDLDHYIAVNLGAFKAITDSIGGVYVDVDRAYDDGKIVLDPGYQLLDGLNAQRFCRTRHDQNVDFGRMARQQRFLAAARQQVMKWNLPLKLPGLIKTIFKYADTDLSANEVIKLAYWVTRLDSGGMKRAEIIGPTGEINGAYYVLPSEEELQRAIRDFFTPPVRLEETTKLSPVAPSITVTLSPAALSGVSVDVVNATGFAGQGALAALWLERQGASVTRISSPEEPIGGDAVVRYPGGREGTARAVAAALGIQQVQRDSSVEKVTAVLCDAYFIAGSQSETPALREGSSAWRALQRESGVALLAPTYVPPDFSMAFDRVYALNTGDDEQPAVRVGYRLKSEDLYAGMSATSWTDAPLAGRGVEVEAGGTIYTAVGASNATDHVWWVKDHVLYWVSNTLFSDVSREELLAMAISAAPVAAE